MYKSMMELLLVSFVHHVEISQTRVVSFSHCLHMVWFGNPSLTGGGGVPPTKVLDQWCKELLNIEQFC
jgi:hypothetical protein